MHSFTQEDLLLYLYGDASKDQTIAIAKALETDWKLKEEYEGLVSSQHYLGKMSFSPRKASVDFILDYAAKPVLSDQETD